MLLWLHTCTNLDMEMFVILWEISKQTNSTQAQLRLIINSNSKWGSGNIPQMTGELTSGYP